MYQRVLAVISFLVRFYSDRLAEDDLEESVIDNLLKEGFELEEINTALTLFLRKPEKTENTTLEKATLRPYWIFNNSVSRKTSPQLRAELLRLYNGSLLTVEEMADLVNACIYCKKEEVELSDLPTLLSGVIKDPLRRWLLLPATTHEEDELFLS